MDHSMMDHNAMDHGGMDHGGMGDGGDMDMCSMSMLFTWNTKNLCLVFDWWHVRTSFGLVLTLLTVVALGMGYEYIRQIARIYDARCASLADTHASLLDTGTNQYTDDALEPDLDASTTTATANSVAAKAEARNRLAKSVIYAVQVFYSFFLMLLFMTYNGWVMLAVTLGAFLGYYTWGSKQPSRKTLACH